jgi:hypothetical protein
MNEWQGLERSDGGYRMSERTSVPVLGDGWLRVEQPPS